MRLGNGLGWGRMAWLGVMLGASAPVLGSCGSESTDDMSGGSAGETGSGASQSGSGATSNGEGGNGDGGSGDGGSGDGAGGTGTGGTSIGQGDGGAASETECNDGVDNDADGQIDYALDPGCYGPRDGTETAGTRAEENGFTTFEFGDDSVVVYVSEEGDDAENGDSPETAVRTLGRATDLVRDGEHDFILLRRGDTWRDEALGRFHSGSDATHPMVLGSYGESLDLPRIEVSENFIDHNGQEQNFVALLDLHLVAYRMDPSSPDYDGSSESTLRYVGTGTNLLIEGCHLEYVDLLVQTSGDLSPYSGVEVRANVIEKAYRLDTCVAGDPQGNSDVISVGMFARHVAGLLIEGNLFDHNGWNEEVDSACATIYNHNAYLNGDDIVLKDNVFSRASSIHIKMKGDAEGDVVGTRIFGNYFVEGEVGVSIGGNNDDPDRFVDSEITANVFSDIGRTQPTTRTLAWGVEVIDNDGLLVQGNYFLNQWAADVTNSYAISLADGSARDVSILDNLFYRVQNRALIAHPSANHENIEVSGNSFIDPDQDSRLIIQDGAFAGYTYADNRYFSSANEGAWFGTEDGNVGVDDWASASGESGAVQLSAVPEFADPERTIETYVESLEVGDSLEAYLSEARLQSRLRYDYELSAPAINQYIRAGFEE